MNNKDLIITLLAIGIVCTGITAFSLGCAIGYGVSKNISVKVLAHD